MKFEFYLVYYKLLNIYDIFLFIKLYNSRAKYNQ